MVDWIAAGAMVVCLRGLLWNALRLRLTGSTAQPCVSRRELLIGCWLLLR